MAGRRTPPDIPASLLPSERAMRYVEGIRKGKIDVPEYVKLAADRYYCFARGEFEYRPKNIDARVRLAEKLELPEINSADYTKFVLLPYQCMIMGFLYGFRENGYRAVKKLLLLIPRKAGKSSLFAAILIGELIQPMGGGRNREIMAAGINTATALHSFGKAGKMLRADEKNPNGLVEKYGVKIGTEAITCEHSGSKLVMATAGSRTLDGFTSSTICVDEISAFKDNQAINTLYSGMGFDPNRLLMMASTEGDLPDSALDTERELCINLLKSKEKKVSYIGVLFAASLKDDFSAEKTWARVQPRLYDPTGDQLTHYRELCAAAKVDDQERENFLLRLLNVPLGGGKRWINEAEYDLIPRIPKDEVWPPQGHEAKRHFIGVDLGDTKDASVVCLASIGKDEIWEARFWIYYPDGSGEWRDESDHHIAMLISGGINKKYMAMARKGHAFICNGPVVNHEMIADRIKVISETVKIQGIYSDPYHGLEELIEALPQNLKGKVLKIPKTPTNVSPAVRQAESKFKQGLLRIQDNPIVRDHFTNACAFHYEVGAVVIRKATMNSLAHIDSADAFLNCIIGRTFVNSHERFIGTDVNPLDNPSGGFNPEDYFS